MPHWTQRNWKLNQELADYIHEHYKGMNCSVVQDLVWRRFDIYLSHGALRNLMDGKSWTHKRRITARELMKIAEKNRR